MANRSRRGDPDQSEQVGRGLGHGDEKRVGRRAEAEDGGLDDVRFVVPLQTRELEYGPVYAEVSVGESVLGIKADLESEERLRLHVHREELPGVMLP